MPNVLVMGSQWGDEGKGKVVDLLAERASYVVRYGGGANAGHTIHANGSKLVLHLLPSGMLHRNVRGVVGNGCVVQLSSLLEEVRGLAELQLEPTPDTLVVSRFAHLVTPYHLAADAFFGKAIGTTGRGIGPAYGDKVRRAGVRVADLEAGHSLPLLEAQEDWTRKVLGAFGFEGELPTAAEAELALRDDFQHLARFVGDPAPELGAAMKRGARILFEGAQGSLLDVDHGTYPFVTSSTTTVGGVSSGVGVYVPLDHRVAVMKAYTTRVGNGPFPTELTDAKGELLRERGAEYGATTGRPRRCGWLDLPGLRRAFLVNGFDRIALTKLDVLEDVGDLEVAVEESGEDGRTYETLPGFGPGVAGARSLEDLPATALAYTERIARELDVQYTLISTGTARESTIAVQLPW